MAGRPALNLDSASSRARFPDAVAIARWADAAGLRSAAKTKLHQRKSPNPGLPDEISSLQLIYLITPPGRKHYQTKHSLNRMVNTAYANNNVRILASTAKAEASRNPERNVNV
jgi:hypothetical protein